MLLILRCKVIKSIVKLVNKFHNMNKTLKKISDLGAIKALKKGESVSFPIAKLSSIRSNASNINAIRGYTSISTKIDREGRKITAIRIA